MSTQYMVVDYIVDDKVNSDNPNHDVELCSIIDKGWPVRVESNDEGLNISVCGYKYVSKEVSMLRLEKHLGKLIIKVSSESSTEPYVDSEYYIRATKQEINGRISVRHELLKYDLLEMPLEQIYKCSPSFSIDQLEWDLEKCPERFISITFGTKDKIDHDSFQVTRMADGVMYIKQLNVNLPKPSLKNATLIYGIPNYDGASVYFNINI